MRIIPVSDRELQLDKLKDPRPKLIVIVRVNHVTRPLLFPPNLFQVLWIGGICLIPRLLWLAQYEE